MQYQFVEDEDADIESFRSSTEIKKNPLKYLDRQAQKVQAANFNEYAVNFALSIFSMITIMFIFSGQIVDDIQCQNQSQALKYLLNTCLVYCIFRLLFYLPCMLVSWKHNTFQYYKGCLKAISITEITLQFWFLVIFTFLSLLEPCEKYRNPVILYLIFGYSVYLIQLCRMVQD